MNAIRHSLLILFLGCLVCVVLLPAAPRAADADVVHLRTGETVKGRPLPRESNEDFLVMEDYLSGATRTFTWSVVDAHDVALLMRELVDWHLARFMEPSTTRVGDSRRATWPASTSGSLNGQP